MKRLAMIGLDAAEPQLLEQMMAQGEMPALARLKATGASCRLHSEATWRAGRVWETLLTGTADYPSAALFDPRTYDSFQIGSRRKTPFYAQARGTKVLALDVPYMSLWYDVPGAQVIWGGHDAGYPRASRPAGLVSAIDERFGVHPAFHNDFDCAWWDEASINTLAEALMTGSRRRLEIVAWLHERFPDWNLFLTVLSEAHSAGEMFWHGMAEGHPLSSFRTAPLARQRLLETYRELDRSIARLLEILPANTTVMVCSLHGMETNDYDVPSMALLPELLYRANFGRSLLQGPSAKAWSRQGCPAIVPRSDEKWVDHMRNHFGVGPMQRLLTDLPRTLGLARSKKRPIHELTHPIRPETDRLPEQIDEPRMSLDWQLTRWYHPHWPNMRAFALPVFYDGRVRINLRGREREGIVERRDYHETCDWVEQLLAECRNVRDGRPALASLERRRSADPFDPQGSDADLIVTWNPTVDALKHPRLGTIGPFPFRRTGGHTDRGFAYVAGPGIARQDLGTREALDLTPTLLELLGHPTAGRSIFHGRVAAA